MSVDREVPGSDDELLAGLAALPRFAPVDPRQADRIAAQLHREGFFRRRTTRGWWSLASAAAAVTIFAAGAWAGARYARRDSLEDMLSRKRLTVAERVLLLQRAGSAYVQAAQGYADATANVDSNAVEVASRVLLGAAHAVARNSLDAGLSQRLANALAPAPMVPVSNNRKPVTWF
jgi:hypothetical protein